MNRTGYTATWLALAAYVATRSAAAQGSPVQYSAPAACPDGAAFVEAVKARGGDVTALSREKNASDPNAVLFVRIAQQPTGFEGRLTLNSADKLGGRTARGATCEEVVDAMAVVTVLTLEQKANGASPDADLGLHADSVPSADSVPTADSASALAEAAPLALAKPSVSQAQPDVDHAPTTFAGHSPMGMNVRESIPVAAGTLHVDAARSLTLQGGAVFGVLPVVMPQVSLTLVTPQFLTLPGGAQKLVGVIPMLRLSVLGRNSLQRGEDRVELGGILGAGGIGLALGVCNSPHYNTSGWTFLWCAEIGGQVLGLRATRAETTRQSSRAMLDLGASFSAEYNFNSLLHATATAQGGVQLGEYAVGSSARENAVSLGTAFGVINLGIGVHF